MPVDFSYSRKYAYPYTFTLPEGYSIIESPENKIVKWPDGVRIMRVFDTDEQSFSISYILTLERSLYSVSEYDAIRQFFDSYIAMSQEQVELEKK